MQTSLLVEKYDYPSLKRKNVDGMRNYVGDSGVPVPSVTTVLSETGDKTALLAWKARVGEKEAQRISNESANLGTFVHDALEKYSMGLDWHIGGTNMFRKLAHSMAEKVIKEGLSQVDELWGVEVPIIAEGLYAGTIDAVGLYKGSPSIIDFKTAKEMKRREWIEDYFLQGSAYALAHNEYFGTEINQIVILMVDRNTRFRAFVANGHEFNDFSLKWASRVEQYYSKR